MKEKEQLKAIRACKESDETIKNDIKATENDIKKLQDEIDVLSVNRIKNKLDIYKRSGTILRMKDFIDYLNSILNYRNEQSKLK